jgi:hypothetical protein
MLSVVMMDVVLLSVAVPFPQYWDDTLSYFFVQSPEPNCSLYSILLSSKLVCLTLANILSLF